MSVAEQAEQITPAALDFLNGVSEISFSPWADELEAGVKRHAGAVGQAVAAVEARLRELRRSQSEYAWGAAMFAARAATVAERSTELPDETRAALGRPWQQLLTI